MTIKKIYVGKYIITTETAIGKKAVEEAERLTKNIQKSTDLSYYEKIEWWMILNNDYCPRCGMRGCSRH